MRLPSPPELQSHLDERTHRKDVQLLSRISLDLIVFPSVINSVWKLQAGDLSSSEASVSGKNVVTMRFTLVGKK